MVHPAEDKTPGWEHGLVLAFFAACGMAVIGAMFAACAAVAYVYQWNEPVGVVSGIVGILLFFFILGATADWTDE